MSSPLRAYGNKRKRKASPASPSPKMSKKIRANLDSDADAMNEYDGTEGVQAVDQQEVLTRGMGRLGVDAATTAVGVQAVDQQDVLTRGMGRLGVDAATTAVDGDLEMDDSGESPGSPAGAVESGEGGGGGGEDVVVGGDSGAGGEVGGDDPAEGTEERFSRYSGGGGNGGSWPGLWSELPFQWKGEQDGDEEDDDGEKSSEEEEESTEDEANGSGYAGSDGDSWASGDEQYRPVLGDYDYYDYYDRDGKYDGDEHEDEDDSTGDYHSDSAVNLPTQDSVRTTGSDANNDSDFENDSPGSSEFTSFLSDDVVPLDEWVHNQKYGKHLCKIVDAKSLCERKISTEELQQAGHSAAHIKLVHSLQDRGFEALLPWGWKYELSWLPEVLFCRGNEDDLMIRSVQTDQHGAKTMLTRLLELGIDMRSLASQNEGPDSLNQGRRTPEVRARINIQATDKWTRRDAEMNTPRADEVFPRLLAYVVERANTPTEVLQAKALASMEKIHQQYRRNFRINTTDGSAQEQFAIPLPNVYALVLCHTFVGLVVYRPDANIDPQADVNGSAEMVASFDFASADHDVWNVLAVFIVLCHVRNERLAMKLATGWVDDSPPEEDPDA